MLSIAELAARDGVSKPTVSVAVKRLVERNGLTVERDGQGRVARVNAAEYDYLRNRYGDPSKAQAPVRAAPVPEEPPPPLRAADGYDEALRQKTWIDAETRRLGLNERRGNLVRRDRMEAALLLVAEEIGRHFDELAQEADTLADAYTKDGLHGLRVALKQLGRAGRTRMADALAAAIPAAPATDEPLPITEGEMF